MTEMGLPMVEVDPMDLTNGHLDDPTRNGPPPFSYAVRRGPESGYFSREGKGPEAGFYASEEQGVVGSYPPEQAYDFEQDVSWDKTYSLNGVGSGDATQLSNSPRFDQSGTSTSEDIECSDMEDEGVSI
jgi:hypothetical protein